MENGINIIQESIHKLSNDIATAFNNKFKEACEIWSVDITNHEEMKRRCKLVTFIDGQASELHIDGKLVMIYTDPKPNEFDIMSNEPFKMGASFRCSEIRKPSDN